MLKWIHKKDILPVALSEIVPFTTRSDRLSIAKVLSTQKKMTVIFNFVLDIIREFFIFITVNHKVSHVSHHKPLKARQLHNALCCVTSWLALNSFIFLCLCKGPHGFCPF